MVLEHGIPDVIKLLVADDHPLFREALRGVLRKRWPEAQIFEADNADDLYALAEAQQDADLLLLDLSMPGAHGFSALVHLRATQPQLPAIVISAREEPTIMRRALEHGAAGFIPKSLEPAQIGEAVACVLDGGTWVPEAAAQAPAIDSEEARIAARVRELTPQQFRVLTLLGSGQLNKQIAWQLGVSEATIKAHMTAILRKLGVGNRTQAVLLVARLALDPGGVVPPLEEGE